MLLAQNYHSWVWTHLNSHGWEHGLENFEADELYAVQKNFQTFNHYWLLIKQDEFVVILGMGSFTKPSPFHSPEYEGCQVPVSFVTVLAIDLIKWNESSWLHMHHSVL